MSDDHGRVYAQCQTLEVLRPNNPNLRMGFERSFASASDENRSACLLCECVCHNAPKLSAKVHRRHQGGAANVPMDRGREGKG